LGKVWSHLYGRSLATVLSACSEELNNVEVDWLRVRPVVKVIGEFWAQLTESDGNFRMLEFLEKEGAEVSVEPISTWVLYMLHQRKARTAYRQQMGAYLAPWTAPSRAITSRAFFLGKRLLLTIGEEMYQYHFRRLATLLGLSDERLIPQKALSALGAPYYNTFLRGGEGHLEVAKTLYYTRRKVCHLVLGLKPFGCLPSVQSDAVQASLVERFPEVRFLPIETSADGEIHAYSRVQMALSEARASASLEFERAVQSARNSLEDIRSYVAAHADLRHSLYPIPRHPGVISTAANFLMHADHLMSSPLAQDKGLHPWREQEAKQARLRQIPSAKEIES
jgi:predicted nucleotide-binding protein (sugar kinase/HSP70/actin superfamily)